jgi:lipoprotein-anchoring transpeptidase ErfK/SrfK
MGKHRLEPPTRVRPRVGRIAAATLSLSVTVVALLAGPLNLIPLGGVSSAADNDQLPSAASADLSSPDVPTPSSAATTPKVPSTPTTTPSTKSTPESSTPDPSARLATTALPADSGTGRRVVFSMTDQRVWLVSAKGAVTSTYLVSGSLTDNLHPGKYDVYSRSRWAVGIDDSGVMQYFVRFTRGNNAAIGFHSIPTKNGEALQSVKQLGTPQSHGCIRQKLTDAERMWSFAQDGTDVVVLA